MSFWRQVNEILFFSFVNVCFWQVGAWRSLVARQFWELEVAGSNPVAPTIFFFSSINQKSPKSLFFY